MNPYQKTIEIEPIITWNSDPENYVMQTSYSKEGNGIDITITNPNGDEPDLFTTCPLIIEQRGFVEAAKGTKLFI